MKYTERYNELKAIFSPEKREINITGSGISILNIQFRSEGMKDFISLSDSDISENCSFSYPVFAPADRTSSKVILLLHGLNERSWLKYLTWAFWLAENTGSYVILFPISFHINRSPELWKDPRAMLGVVNNRNASISHVNCLSFVNVALSNRLSEDPLRFFKSGYQTVSDIVRLVNTIKKGEHEIIPKTDKVDLFAYSIGAFMAEIMLMGNPEELFSESKLFMFCGGSVFSNMNGASKLIMDSYAFNKVYDFYMNDFEDSINEKSPMFDFLSNNRLGISFRAMIDLSRFRAFREVIFRKLRDQIHSISLMKDTVIPPIGILGTLHKKEIVDVWDFPYNYSHENPFPLFKNSDSVNVDECFERVFTGAAEFLS
jgi:hypothetical protein